MVSFSSASVGLSSGTFPFSISTFPSITCVSTPLAVCTNFWRFQEKGTQSKRSRLKPRLRPSAEARTSFKEDGGPAVPLWWWDDWPSADGFWVRSDWWPWHGGPPRETGTLTGWRSWFHPPWPRSHDCTLWTVWLKTFKSNRNQFIKLSLKSQFNCKRRAHPLAIQTYENKVWISE